MQHEMRCNCYVNAVVESLRFWLHLEAAATESNDVSIVTSQISKPSWRGILIHATAQTASRSRKQLLHGRLSASSSGQ